MLPNADIFDYQVQSVFIFDNFAYQLIMMMNSPFQKIQLFLSCRNLKDLDVFSKSDPYIKVYFKRDFNVKQYSLYGRTQTAVNNLNPTYKKSFQIDYIFQCKQDIKFDVFDDDNGNDEFIGSAQTTIGALMGAKNQTSIIDLKLENKNLGKLIVRCQKLTESNQFLNMKFKGVKLMNTDSIFDFWDKSDPYLKFLKVRDDNTYIEVARTQKILDSLNPTWNPIQIQLGRLVNEKLNRFKLQCWDWQENGKDQFIGECFVQLAQLKAFQGMLELQLSNANKKKPGKIVLDQFKLIKRPSFIDYLKGGLELNMIIAIDFTGSNGNPTSPNSLHFMDPVKPNQYQTAILAIAQILLNYDSDKRIPSFGFGAQPKYPGFNTVSHCFPLAGNMQNSEAMGMEHLMTMYTQAVKNVSFSGPTYFSQIIQETMKLAYQCKNSGSRTYQTLLILTDGQIHDMSNTIDLLVKGTDLPISIIIVGVGNANFDSMQKLDGDGGLYDSNGKKAPRDIVQFVPFRDVKFNPDMLCKQLLAELPNQVVQYMLYNGIIPNKPQQVNLDNVVPINHNPKDQVLNMLNQGNFINNP